MASKSRVHVIAKANIAEHTIVSTSPQSLPPLQDGHIHARSALIALTSNNLSYAQLGTLLSWWNAFPVPESLPAPYNDPSKYGIVPAWGYAEVLESKVSGIQEGNLLLGFWSTSHLLVDLQLVPGDAPGHWFETSDHRKGLMTLYQRYILQDSNERISSLTQQQVDDMAWEAACRPIWEAGYLLNKAVFTAPAIHPSADGEWDARDAELGKAVVISLSASGKTARAFTDGLINNRSAGTGPLGLLAITSTTHADFLPTSPFPTLVVSYEAMAGSETLTWVADRKPHRIVVADFGGRGDSLSRLVEALGKSFGSSAEVVVIGVGGSVDIQTPEQLGQWAAQNATISSIVRMNTSPIRDACIRQEGADVYFKGLDRAWKAFIQGASVRDMKLEIGHGVEGFEDGWTKLCKGNVSGKTAQVYDFR